MLAESSGEFMLALVSEGFCNLSDAHWSVQQEVLCFLHTELEKELGRRCAKDVLESVTQRIVAREIANAAAELGRSADALVD
jgi:hypothetical protein